MSLFDTVSTVIERDPFLAIIFCLVVWWVVEEWRGSS